MNEILPTEPRIRSLAQSRRAMEAHATLQESRGHTVKFFVLWKMVLLITGATVIAGCGATEPSGIEDLGLVLSGTVASGVGEAISGAVVQYRTGRSCDENFFLAGETQTNATGSFQRTLVSIDGKPECLLVVATAEGFTPDSTRISLPPFSPAPNYGALDLELELAPE